MGIASPIFAVLVVAGVAALVAGIGAFATLTTFVGNRDIKISEFRQNWINLLRESVIAFCASSRTIAIHIAARERKPLRDQSDVLVVPDAISEARQVWASSYHSVVLLLNLKELEHIELKKSMVDVQNTLGVSPVVFANIQIKLEKIEEAASLVIKKEWRVIGRVGNVGRRWLVTAGVCVLIAFILGFGLLALAFWKYV